MNHVLRNGFFYFLTIAGAAAMPLMAHAEGPDDGDGPEVSIIRLDDETHVPAAKKGEKDSKKKGASIKALEPDNYGRAGGIVGGSKQQGFTVGGGVGYSGDHEGAAVTAMLGAGGPSIFGIDASVMGMRTNGNSKGGVTVAGLLNGSASVGTSGGGKANGVVAAAVIVPFTASKDLSCMLGIGPAAGGMYSNELAGTYAHGTKDRTTEIAGPGAYTGFGCAGSFWKADLYGDAIVNSMHSPKGYRNPSTVGAETRLELGFRVNDSMAIGAFAQVDADIRRVKDVAEDPKIGAVFVGGGMMSGTFGHTSAK